MIYCWFIYSPSISPLPAPLISITVQRGGFLISCMKTMPLLFWLHLPNKPPAAHGDRWPPIITECLIDPGRAQFACVSMCVCVWESAQGRLTSVMHLMCAGPRWMHPPTTTTKAHPDACLPACPWDRWMNDSPSTSVHSHQTRRCNWVPGWCEWAWAQSIHPPYYHPAPVLRCPPCLPCFLSLSLPLTSGESKWEEDVSGGGVQKE